MNDSSMPLLAKIMNARYSYEFNGESLDAIATRLDLPLASLQREAYEQNWTRHAEYLPTDPGNSQSAEILLPTRSNRSVGASTPYESLKTVTKQTVTIQDAYRLQAVHPMLVAAEVNFMNKVYRAIDELNMSNIPHAVKTLKTLNDLLVSVRDRMPTEFQPALPGNRADKPPVNVNIQNNIQ